MGLTPGLRAKRVVPRWAACQIFVENDRGSIEVGKLADLVILSVDPTSVDPEALDQIDIPVTIKDNHSNYVAGRERADIVAKEQMKDLTNWSKYKLFKVCYVQRWLHHLLEDMRTAEARESMRTVATIARPIS